MYDIVNEMGRLSRICQGLIDGLSGRPETEEPMPSRHRVAYHSAYMDGKAERLKEAWNKHRGGVN